MREGHSLLEPCGHEPATVELCRVHAFPGMTWYPLSHWHIWYTLAPPEPQHWLIFGPQRPPVLQSYTQNCFLTALQPEVYTGAIMPRTGVFLALVWPSAASYPRRSSNQYTLTGAISPVASNDNVIQAFHARGCLLA